MAWEPKQVFAGSSGTLRERRVKMSALVHVGDILGQLDDRELFNTVETRRRAEENARVEVENTRRRYKEVENDVVDAEEAVERAKRSVWGAKDLSKRQVADGEADIRINQRGLEDARRRVGEAKDAITAAERASAEAQMLLREARDRLGHTTITSPITGYVIEMLVHEGQQVSRGMHLFTIAPLDEYQLNVPIPDFDEFQRIKKGLTAYVTIEEKGPFQRPGQPGPSRARRRRADRTAAYR
jgi:multidrug resistance efflux pump